MPRGNRIVIPGLPHHITQRGNRKQPVFFSDDDRHAYCEIIAHYCKKTGTSCLGWCLMDNHVHLILVPPSEDSLRATIAPAHTAYSQRVNALQETSGHLFQGRFASYAMDDAHLFVAARYVENNPVKAGLVEHAEDWPWSSARAHILGETDGLTDIAPLGQHIGNWRTMLAGGLEAADEAVEKAFRSGLPMGGEAWLSDMTERLGRRLVPAKTGPKGPWRKI
jgi:putative transposase